LRQTLSPRLQDRGLDVLTSRCGCLCSFAHGRFGDQRQSFGQHMNTDLLGQPQDDGQTDHLVKGLWLSEEIVTSKPLDCTRGQVLDEWVLDGWCVGQTGSLILMG